MDCPLLASSSELLSKVTACCQVKLRKGALTPLRVEKTSTATRRGDRASEGHGAPPLVCYREAR
eukprot:3228591-Pyramimonas_sp.AAC.1